MSQLDVTSDTTRTDPGSRHENYLEWRQRLADRQEDLRNIGEPEPTPAVSSEWSPEALFRTDGGSTGSDDVAPVDAVADVVVADVAAGVGPETTHAPTADPGWDRAEVDALLRQFRATGGSPRTAARTVNAASGSTPAGRQSPVGRRSDRDPEPDGVVRYLDPARVGRTANPDRPRRAASVAEQLRELNRMRVDGELSDDEFNRRKHLLFTLTSTRRHSSI